MTSVIRGSDDFDTVKRVWRDVTSTRALNTNYTNDTAVPIHVAVQASGGAGVNTFVDLQLASGAFSINKGRTNEVDSTGNFRPLEVTVYAEIPVGAAYRVISTGGSPTLIRWVEYRP